MNPLPVPLTPGGWILAAGDRSLQTIVMAFVARLAERGPLRVLDCGNRFNVYRLSRTLRGRSDLLGRIQVARAFTCHQVFASLERLVELPVPFLALDFLHSFYDESLPFAERRHLLERCLPHLQRLSAQDGGLVSIQPPAVPGPQSAALMALLQAAAPQVWVQELPPALPESPRLF